MSNCNGGSRTVHAKRTTSSFLGSPLGSIKGVNPVWSERVAESTALVEVKPGNYPLSMIGSE